MAYISQETKKELTPAIKTVLKKHGMKGTVSIKDCQGLNVNISSGVLDLLGYWNRYMNRNRRIQNRPTINDKNFSISHPIVDPYFEEYHDNKIENFISELLSAMKTCEWADKSDVMSDYFNITYYVSINVGRYDKPYLLTN